MRTRKNNLRLAYSFVFVIILAVEVLIALFVRDRFIRPYGGDVLVTILICCFGRIFFPDKMRLLSLWVFLFAAAIEVGQYFNFVELMGLQDITFFQIVLGSTFSFADLICYAAGCILFFVSEKLIRKQKKVE